MRIGWVAVGVVGVVAIGLGVVGPGGGGSTPDEQSASPLSRVATARARGRDVKSTMVASTGGRSMLGRGSEPETRPPVRSSTGRGDRARAGAAREDSGGPTVTTGAGSELRDSARQTTTTGRQQTYQERQAERARQIAENREKRRGAQTARNNGRAPRTRTQTPAVRDRMRDIQNARANRVTGSRAGAARGQIGQNQPGTTGAGGPAASVAANLAAASRESSGEQGRGLDAATADALLQQLLSQTQGRNSGGGGSSTGTSQSAGSSNSAGSSAGAGGDGAARGDAPAGSGAEGGSGDDGGAPTQTTGGGGGGGSTPAEGDGPTGVSASGLVRANIRWVPVNPSACGELADAFTNDMYLRLDGPDRLIAVDSGESSPGIRATGAGFYQDETGGAMPPSPGSISGNPCLAFDTFLDFGGEDFTVLTAGGADFGDSNGGTVRATWVSLFGVRGIQDQARFGDSAFYVRLGRYTAPSSISSVAGSILVQVSPSEGGSAEALTLTLPDCASCWGDGGGNSTTGDGATDPGAGGDGDSGDGGTDGGDAGDGSDGGTDGSGGAPDDGGSTDEGDAAGDDGNDGGSGDEGDSDMGDGGDGSEDGGDGGTGDAGDGTDGGDEGGGEDGGGEEDGGEEEPEMPLGIDAVWLSIDNTCDPTGYEECVTPAGFGTYDLYLRMSEPHRMTIVDSGGTSSGLLFGDAEVFQAEGNREPRVGPRRCPCIAYDSYFAFGSVLTSFFTQPPTDLWLSPLEAVWFGEVGTIAQATQETALFGDEAYYFRLMRLTIRPDASMGGNILVLGSLFGTSESFSVEVEIPALPGG